MQTGADNLMEINEEEDINIEERIYKPTGPDGRGWGEFR